MTYINSQDDVILLCIRNNSTRSLLDQNIDSKGSLTALTYRYKSINKSFWSRASKESRVNIPNLRVTAPSTPRAQALAVSDLIHISGLQLSVWHYSQHSAQRGSTKSASECKSAHFLTVTSRLTNPTRGVSHVLLYVRLFTNWTIVKAWLRFFIVESITVTYKVIRLQHAYLHTYYISKKLQLEQKTKIKYCTIY